MPPTAMAFPALAFGAVILAGCGRHATLADCQLIVDRSVELQLKAALPTTGEAIRKREEEVRGAMRDDIASCQGRRVTDKMMACVSAATSMAELDQCLR